MKRTLLAGVLLSTCAQGHRLDEYLQATTISIEREAIQVQIRLIPGVAVYPSVLAEIDRNADDVISEPEQRAYTDAVLHDLVFRIDGRPLHPQVTAFKFPNVEEMKEGRGEIRIDFYLGLPQAGVNRQLVFENRHQSEIAAYLVNCLKPRDPEIHVVKQNRNYSQSLYQLDYIAPAAESRAGSGDQLLIALALLPLLRFTFLSRKRRNLPF